MASPGLSSPLLPLYSGRRLVSLCCLLHAHGAPNKRPDMRRVFWEPQTREEVQSNVAYALRLAAANGIPCVFTVARWCCRPAILLHPTTVRHVTLHDSNPAATLAPAYGGGNVKRTAAHSISQQQKG